MAHSGKPESPPPWPILGTLIVGGVDAGGLGRGIVIDAGRDATDAAVEVEDTEVAVLPAAELERLRAERDRLASAIAETYRLEGEPAYVLASAVRANVKIDADLIARHKAERLAAERERDALIEMCISPNNDGIFYLDLPFGKSDILWCNSRERAIAAVRKAAGLEG